MLRKPSKTSRLAEHIMSHLKTWKILVKTLHIPPENMRFFTDSIDFHPYLPYSMNKKYRWDVDFLAGIEEIQKLHENEEVLFLERTSRGAYNWLRYLDVTLSEQYRIRAVHQLVDDIENEVKTSENDRKIYKRQEINSIFGQDFRNFDAFEGTKNKGIVAYNFLEAQENHMKIFKKKCISRKNDEWPHTTGWQRVKRRKAMNQDLVAFCKMTAVEVVDDDEEDNLIDNHIKVKTKKCYNLEDHIVEKRVRRQRLQRA